MPLKKARKKIDTIDNKILGSLFLLSNYKYDKSLRINYSNMLLLSILRKVCKGEKAFDAKAAKEATSLFLLLKEREHVSAKVIAPIKSSRKIGVYDEKRENEILSKAASKAKARKLPPKNYVDAYRLILKHSRRQMRKK